MMYSVDIGGFEPFQENYFYKTTFIGGKEKITSKGQLHDYYFLSHGKIYVLEEYQSKEFNGYVSVIGKEIDAIEIDNALFFEMMDEESPTKEIDFLNETENEDYVHKLDPFYVTDIALALDDGITEVFGVVCSHEFETMHVLDFIDNCKKLNIAFINNSSVDLGEDEPEL